MRKHSTEAGKWIADNNLSWGPHKQLPQGPHTKKTSSKGRRIKRAKAMGKKLSRHATVKDFVEANRNFHGKECLCVPAAQKGVPAIVTHCGKNMAAARYMLLLTQGAPKSEAMLTRHLCGNGHLSCVNPAHLAWGTPGDNIADATKHRLAGDHVQDKINAI